MKINAIPKTNFKRQLTPLEKIEARAAMTDAKKAIGLQNLAIVTHSISLPSAQNEDVGTGILSSNQGAMDYINFLYDNAIDAISIEPMGLVSPEFYSPYEGSLLSKKQAIDLKELCSDDWANIFDIKSFNEIVENKDYFVQVPLSPACEEFKTVEFDKDMAILDYAYFSMHQAMKKAYTNFKTKVEEKHPRALELEKEFERFKKDNSYYLNGDSIYRVLKIQYDNQPFDTWENPLHRVLFDSKDETFTRQEKQDEIKRIETVHHDEIEFYKFYQFVVNKQQKTFAQKCATLAQSRYEQDIQLIEDSYKKGKISKERYRYLRGKVVEYKLKNQGVNIIGDKQVGYSDMDIFSNPTVFTTDEFMGAPPNLAKGSTGQDWDFRFIPYEKLFDKNGSLAEGGIFLKKAVKKAFEDNPGGLRIDHIIGLIDPWTYEKSTNDKINGAKFSLYLLTQLKQLTELGLTSDKIADLEDVIGAITGENKIEHAILKQRCDIDFALARKILEDKKDFLNDIQNLSVPTGSRHIFKYLLDNELSELQNYGLNKETISGVIDPIKGIFNPQSMDREFLVEREIKDFDKIQEIILSKKDDIDEIYSNLIEKIVLQSAREVIMERAFREGKRISEKEIKEKIHSLIICEDLGSLTLPVFGIMKKFNLIGMRDSARSNPYDTNNIYREINPAQQGNYWIISSHDTLPYKSLYQSFNSIWQNGHTSYLASEMGVDEKKIQGEKNLSRLVQLKVARIFAADKNPKTQNNVMLNWLDIFAIKKQYNTPGLLDKEKNWNLRVSSSEDSFEKRYYEKTLPSGDGIDIMKALAQAMYVCGVSDKNRQTYDELKHLSKVARE